MTATAIQNPLELISEGIADRLDKFRKWLPENPVVKQALEFLATNGKQELSKEDYTAIIKGLVEHTKYLEKEAFIDPKTNYLNVNAFHAALGNIIKQNSNDIAKSNPVQPTTVVVIDLNYLKAFNNTDYVGCGDAAIDYLTKFITEKLRHHEVRNDNERRKNPNSPKDELFTRMSNGDEFGIIMKNCTPKQAQDRIKPILEEMAKESLHGKTPCIATDKLGRKIHLQVSAAFGCAQLLTALPEDKNPSGDKDKDIALMIDATVGIASNAESANKAESKRHAASIDGGFPSIDDRDNAVAKITKILADKFDRAWQKSKTPYRENAIQDYQAIEMRKELLREAKQSVQPILQSNRHQVLDFSR